MENNLETEVSILKEWEDLFRHPSFRRVLSEIKDRIDLLQASMDNRTKQPIDLNDSVKIAADGKAKNELSRLLNLFDSLKQQIMEQKRSGK